MPDCLEMPYQQRGIRGGNIRRHRLPGKFCLTRLEVSSCSEAEITMGRTGAFDHGIADWGKKIIF